MQRHTHDDLELGGACTACAVQAWRRFQERWPGLSWTDVLALVKAEHEAVPEGRVD